MDEGRLRRRPLLLLVALLSALGLCGPAHADVDADVAEATDEAGLPSLEELTRQSLPGVVRDVEVSTGSRFSQGATRAPTLTYVVTAEMIRAFGLRSMSDILRVLPGLYVSENTIFSYVGARGLGRPGDFNGRLLVLLDGVRVNQNIHDAALIGPEFPIDADMIERVEFSPGPGSALYGNNAFFGVINVISKRADRLAGTELRATLGSAGQRGLRASTAQRLDGGAEFGLSASGFERARMQLPDYVPERYAGIYERRDWDRGEKLSAYVAWQGLTLRAGHSERRRGTPYRIEPLEPLTLDQSRRTMRSDSLSLELERSLGPDWDLSAQLSAQRHLFRVDDPFVDRAGTLQQYRASNLGRWANAELRLGRSLGQTHYLSFGLDYQHDAQQRSEYGVVGQPYDAAFWGTDRRWGLFVQDSWQLHADHQLVLGLRHDQAEEAGTNLNPRLAWVWTVSPSSTARLLYGSAFRGANLFEFQVNASNEPELPTPRSERIRTLELAWDQGLSPSLRYRASIYRSRISHLITYDAVEWRYFNADAVRSEGLDLSLQWQARSGMRLDASWSAQNSRDALGQRLSNSPRQMFKLHWSVPLASERWSLGVQLLGLSRRSGDGQTAPGYVLSNLRLSWRPDGLTELGLGLYNAADIRFYDKPDPGAGPLQRQESRNLLLQLTRRFGA